MSIYKKMHLVCVSLILLANRTYQYAIAIHILLEENKRSVQNSQDKMLELSTNAMVQVLFMDIAKMFDPPEKSGNENCSLKLLQMLCKSYERFKPEMQDLMASKIDLLCKQYDTMPEIKRIRNKILSHNDLKSMFYFEQNPLYISDIIKLLENILSVLNDILEQVLGVSFTQPDKLQLEEEYRKSVSKFF